MPSANKTPNIGLNQWQGNEYIKREDFVADNLAIDAKFKEMEDNLGNIEVPVTSVNEQTGNVNLKAEHIKTADGKTLEEFKTSTNASLAEITQAGLKIKNKDTTVQYYLKLDDEGLYLEEV